MAELIALIVSAVLLILLLMPVIVILRLARLGRDLQALSDRVARLEADRAARSVPHGVAWDREAAGAVMPPSSAAPGPASRGAPRGGETRQAVEPPMAAPDAPPPASAGRGSELLDEIRAADLEARIGGRGSLYAGVLVLLFGVSFFLKYAFDNAWITETMRVLLGAAGGVGLVAGGLRIADRALAAFAHALIGTGLAILYLSTYGALNFYGLIGPSFAFLTMAAITCGAAAIAHGRRAQSLAVIAVGGGYLTPALIGAGRDAQLTLFSYTALLAGGTLVLASAHRWLALNALSYAATAATALIWAMRFYTPDLWLRTLLFLTLYCVLFLVILRETRRVPGATARVVSALLASAPVLYHVAAIVLTSARPPAIHVYLIAFTAVGLWFTADPHRPGLRLVLLLAAWIPMFGHLTLPRGSEWLATNVVAIGAVSALHLVALGDRSFRQKAPLAQADLVALHVNGLGLFGLLYQTLHPVHPGAGGSVAALLAALALLLARRLRSLDPAASAHAGALALTLAAVGLAVQFDGAPVIVGWGIEGAAVAWIGRRQHRPRFEAGGLALWALAVSRLVESFTAMQPGLVPIANARAVAAFVVICGAYLLASRRIDRVTPPGPQRRAVLHVFANLLTLGWITAEIRSYWAAHSETQAQLYAQAMLSLAWGLYGAALIAAGMRRAYPAIRYLGIAVLAAASLKVFFYDLWALGGIYRVVGSIAFGVLLVLVSYLYQRRQSTAARS